MKLLITIVHNPERVLDVLDEFYRIGVKGATVMDSVGMAQMMAHNVPFFARFAEFGQDPAHNRTIFAVIRTQDCLERAVFGIERALGNLDEPDTGVVFTLPIDYCKGMESLERDE